MCSSDLDIDTSHLGFLHLGAVAKGAFHGVTDENVIANRAPEYICEETPCGTTYGAYRPSEDGNTYWRFAHFLFPFWTMPPINPFDAMVATESTGSFTSGLSDIVRTARNVLGSR